MSNVNHPSHYNCKGKKECIVEMYEKFGFLVVAIFCALNAYKYLYRAGYKDDLDQDMNKARWYISYANEILEHHCITRWICTVFFSRILKYVKETNV